MNFPPFEKLFGTRPGAPTEKNFFKKKMNEILETTKYVTKKTNLWLGAQGKKITKPYHRTKTTAY